MTTEKTALIADINLRNSIKIGDLIGECSAKVTGFGRNGIEIRVKPEKQKCKGCIYSIDGLCDASTIISL